MGLPCCACAIRRAWREGFTITLVSGRTVGIGAYLARLGRRCVQRADQPIILTGFQALNKVLGKEVRGPGCATRTKLLLCCSCDCHVKAL